MSLRSTLNYITDTTLPFQTTIWLPNAQLTVKPSDFLLCVLLHTSMAGLTQPSDCSTSWQTTLVNNTIPITAGNPSLKDVTSWNFEANTQIFVLLLA